MTTRRKDKQKQPAKASHQAKTPFDKVIEGLEKTSINNVSAFNEFLTAIQRAYASTDREEEKQKVSLRLEKFLTAAGKRLNKLRERNKNKSKSKDDLPLDKKNLIQICLSLSTKASDESMVLPLRRQSLYFLMKNGLKLTQLAEEKEAEPIKQFVRSSSSSSSQPQSLDKLAIAKAFIRVLANDLQSKDLKYLKNGLLEFFNLPAETQVYDELLQSLPTMIEQNPSVDLFIILQHILAGDNEHITSDTIDLRTKIYTTHGFATNIIQDLIEKSANQGKTGIYRGALIECINENKDQTLRQYLASELHKKPSLLKTINSSKKLPKERKFTKEELTQANVINTNAGEDDFFQQAANFFEQPGLGFDNKTDFDQKLTDLIELGKQKEEDNEIIAIFLSDDKQDNMPAVQYWLGEAYFYQENWDEAFKYYVAAAQQQHTKAYYALKTLAKVIEQKPTLEKLNDQIATALTDMATDELDTATDELDYEDLWELKCTDPIAAQWQRYDALDNRLTELKNYQTLHQRLQRSQIAIGNRQIKQIEARMRRCALNVYCQDLTDTKAKDLLTAYYQSETAKWQLVTSYVYEANRHTRDDPQVERYARAFALLWPQQDLAQLCEDLRKHEQDSSSYYGEDLSDDSDDEQAESFVKLAPQMQTPTKAVRDIHEHIGKQNLTKFNKFLEKIANLGPDKNSTKYNDLLRELGTIFEKNIIDNSNVKSGRINDDYNMLNKHVNQGHVAFSALADINTNFRILQLRGIDYKLDKWNLPHRRQYRERIKYLHSNGGLAELGLYSEAVYRKAGIPYGLERTHLQKYQLEKLAKLLQLRLKYFLMQPYDATHFVFNDQQPNHTYTSCGDYIQKYYSENYDKFIKFLDLQINRQSEFGKLLYNNGNFFISCGDMPRHPGRYAYGNKFYSDQQDKNKNNRLRPRYNRGEPGHPHSGVIFLMLNHLSDYANHTCNHVPSLIANKNIGLGTRIAHERESSFFSYIPKGRLKAVHFAKYPSFKSETHQPTHFFKYGLTKELYLQFRSLIVNSAPHSDKQRLAITALGEYLTVYYQYYLYFNMAKSNLAEDQHLLFRTAQGNFSYVPDPKSLPDHSKKAAQKNTVLGKRKNHVLTTDEAADENTQQDANVTSSRKKQRLSEKSIVSEQDETMPEAEDSDSTAIASTSSNRGFCLQDLLTDDEEEQEVIIQQQSPSRSPDSLFGSRSPSPEQQDYELAEEDVTDEEDVSTYSSGIRPF